MKGMYKALKELFKSFVGLLGSLAGLIIVLEVIALAIAIPTWLLVKIFLNIFGGIF